MKHKIKQNECLIKVPLFSYFEAPRAFDRDEMIPKIKIPWFTYSLQGYGNTTKTEISVNMTIKVVNSDMSAVHWENSSM